MTLRKTIEVVTKLAEEGAIKKYAIAGEPYQYPDISDILALKARGRLELARLSFGEKLDILEKLRERVAPIIQARQERRRLEEHSQRMIGIFG